MKANTARLQVSSSRTCSWTPQEITHFLVESGLLSSGDAARVLEMHRRTKEPVEEIIATLGMVPRLRLYQALAQAWGYPFVNLLETEANPRLARRFDPRMLIEQRFFPLYAEGNRVVIAIARQPSPELAETVRRVLGPVAVAYRITTPWDIHQAVHRYFRDIIVDRAVHALYYRAPEESAYTVMVPWQFALLFAFLGLVGLGIVVAPRPTLIFANILVNLGFIASILFKFAVSLAGARHELVEPISQEEVAALSEDELPTYTILVPLYRETSMIPTLIQGLQQLDYPASKLEVLLLLEEDDEETIAAARAARPPANFTFVIIPNSLPKTKPKACNVGLFYARGEYIVIYDAEDIPEPDQLKKAVVAFRKGPPNLVCVQAALNFYNITENFLTRMFTLEFCYWFDYMLPGLDRLRFPIPLGGTSNHFRTDVLRRLGGWDPFNMTEDADLGIRAAMNGYTVGVINSTTYEEANKKLPNWIRQRSRWIKGYMQTTLVHARNPIRLLRRAGLRNTFGFFMLVGGTPLTFLFIPPMWMLFILSLVGPPDWLAPFFPPFVLYISLFNLLVGNGLMIYLNMLAVFKRRYYHLILYALLNPFYWLLHSIAAYKALWQLFTRPFYWEKTTHGITTFEPTIANGAGR